MRNAWQSFGVSLWQLVAFWPPAQGLAMSSNVTADSSASASDFAPETKRRKFLMLHT